MKKDIFLLVFLILPAVSPLFQKGYFSMHDDLQSMRQYQQDLCFIDRQIPCRWVSDLGYGFGYPLFNFYPPLPYLIGQLYRWAGLAYIDVVKAVGITGFITTALFMYLLGRQFWGRAGGLISAAFYTYAPYHSVDFYVRGAMNEFWAMAFYPAIFYCTFKLIQTRTKKYIPLTALSVAGLMLSHNPMLMIFAPPYFVWIFYWLWHFKTLKPVKHLALSAAWSWGLAAFFTLPAVFESKFVSLWTLTSGYFNYLAHFLDLNQIFFKINWGYGSSELGPADSMSFALGYLHWIIPAVVLALSLVSKKLKNNKSLFVVLTAVILGSLFMSHSKSTPLWLRFKPLEFLQFPWRFLTLSVFAASLLSGALGLIAKNKLIFAGTFTLLLLLNANYFRPRQWYPDMTDSQKFSGPSWQLLVTSGIFDYLPIYAPLPPADARGEEINITRGEAIYSPLEFRSNYQEYLVTVLSDSAIAELQTYYFPGWRVWVDGVERGIDPSRDKLLGRIRIDLPSGRHEILARFGNTPIRTVGNILSAVSWTLLLVWFVRIGLHASSRSLVRLFPSPAQA